MFGGKVHVISSSNLVHSLHRQPKVVSFWFLEAQFTTKLGGMSESSTKKLVDNLSPESNHPSLLIEGLKVTQQALSPHAGMDQMLRVAADTTKNRLDGMLKRLGTTIDLWAWTQHEITVITTESVYGPANPYRDAAVEAGFW
jgi:hypothetical protein